MTFKLIGNRERLEENGWMSQGERVGGSGLGGGYASGSGAWNEVCDGIRGSRNSQMHLFLSMEVSVTCHS